MEVIQLHHVVQIVEGFICSDTTKINSIRKIKITNIHAILSNPKLSSLLYFDPSVEDDQKCAFWHGTIWQESPLYNLMDLL